MLVVPFKASGAQTTSTTGDAIRLSKEYTEAQFILDVTALATDSGDTLDVYLDCSADGITWLNSIHFTQVLGNGSAAKIAAKVTKSGDYADPDAVLAVTADASAGVARQLGILPYWRYRSSITDASTDNASFTYSLTGTFLE